MGDLFFLIRTVIMTFTLVFLMQIKVGEQTLEQRSMLWIQESVFVDSLQEVAGGAIKVMEQGLRSITLMFDKKVTRLIDQSNEPGNRWTKFALKRSQAVLQEQEEKIKAKALQVKEVVEDRLTETVKEEMNSAGQTDEQVGQ